MTFARALSIGLLLLGLVCLVLVLSGCASLLHLTGSTGETISACNAWGGVHMNECGVAW